MSRQEKIEKLLFSGEFGRLYLRGDIKQITESILAALEEPVVCRKGGLPPPCEHGVAFGIHCQDCKSIHVREESVTLEGLEQFEGHTPGEWSVYDRTVGYALCEIHYGNDGECVAEIVHKTEDAKLIAAAPDLLTLLSEAVGTLRSISKNTCCGKCQEAALVAQAFLTKVGG